MPRFADCPVGHLRQHRSRFRGGECCATAGDDTTEAPPRAERDRSCLKVSILILKEQAAKFRGNVVRDATGNSALDLQHMCGKRVHALQSWGKHFLIVFRGFSRRAHMLLFGSYLIDDAKPGKIPRMSLAFDNGVLNVYASSLKYIEGALDDTYDWRTDVMDPQWDQRLYRDHT